MKQDITTIPISEVLEQTDGCFVCRMRKMLEKRAGICIRLGDDGAGRPHKNEQLGILRLSF